MKLDVISMPLPEEFGRWMTAGQRDLCWLLIVGGGIEPARLEEEIRRLMDANPEAGGLEAVLTAAESILGKKAKQEGEK